jgi:D-alanyl-D-alanine carboxypeptidase
LIGIACLGWIGAFAHGAARDEASPAWGRLPDRTPSLESVSDQVKARACLLVHARTGEVFFARNTKERHPPASTVKVMTALVVYESAGLKGSFDIISSDQAEPSNVPLIPGETVRIYDLVRSVIMGSDNDSAKAIGRYAGGGSLDRFIEMMNEKAVALGCARTHFKNPNGLPAEGQYTCCEDLLKIFQGFLRYPELREFARSKGFALKTKRGEQFVKNHNKLLGVYPGMDAAKTGWTYASRHTYAASIIRNGQELHLIILNSPNKWIDSQVLLNYAFGVLRDRELSGETTTIARHSPAPSPREVPTARAVPADEAKTVLASVPVSQPKAGPSIKVQGQGDTEPEISIMGVEPPVAASSPKSGRGPQEYTIQKGDNLYQISQRFNCTVESIMAANKDISDPTKILPGQTIQIPGD